MNPDRIKKMYDELYARDPGIFGVSSLLYLKKILRKEEIIAGYALDVGAGEGNTSEFLASSGFHVDALDVSEHAFQAVKNTEKIKTHVTPIAEYKLVRQYDLVYFALVLHHLSTEQFSA